MIESSSDDESAKPSTSNLTKKRKRLGRLIDVTKQLRAQSFRLGEDCKSKMFKCFEQINKEERETLIKNFNIFSAIEMVSRAI